MADAVVNGKIQPKCTKAMDMIHQMLRQVKHMVKLKDGAAWTLEEKNMYAMFANAARFNSDISNWNVGAVTNMVGGMFYEASSFNQNLCPWGPKLPANFNYGTFGAAADMFYLSGCANTNTPTGRTGPWCAVTNCPA